jgi:glycosyltransferase involved in cell wall biosynthesis
MTALLLCIPLFAYLLLVMWLIVGFFRVRNRYDKTDSLRCSVIIPFRNESTRLEKLVQQLSVLQYSKENVEFIFVNDHSTDDSVLVLRKLLIGFPFTNCILENTNDKHGKKFAMMVGIENAKNEIIVSRDADTFQESPFWLQRIISKFRNENTQMVAGTIMIEPAPGFLQTFQRLEQSALNTVSRGAIGNRLPLFCSAANMAFRVSAFKKTGGYQTHLHKASGDDVFLMNEIHAHFKEAVEYENHPEATVTTYAVLSYHAYKNQKLRWISKINPGFNPLYFTGIITFLYRINLLFIPVLSLVFPQWSFVLVVLAILAVFFDFLLVFLSSGFKRLYEILWVFPLGILWQAVISPDLVLFSERKELRWKERRIL